MQKIKLEHNLDKFGRFNNNREISKSHVAILAESIKKNGQLMPIVVDSKLRVVDGQHRLGACKALNKAVWYTYSKNLKQKDIAMVNNTQKSWKPLDYLNFFSDSTHDNCHEYKKVGKFIKEYKLPFNVSLMLLSGVTSISGGDRTPYGRFKEGIFEITNLANAEKLAEQLVKLKADIPNLVKINKFCMAFVRVQKLDNFNLKIAHEQIVKNQKFFDGSCINIESWIEAMIEAYNYKLRTKGSKSCKRISWKKDI